MGTFNPFNMARETLISVIMSVHNGEAYLKDAIESILPQKYLEFIIVDDASTDGTASILAQYPTVKVIRNQTNLGLTKSLNTALKVAQGEYIARMDADDISLPHRLQVQKDFLDSHPEIVCVGSSLIIIDAHGKEVGIKQATTDSDLLMFYMILKNQIAHPSVMFRKDIIVKHGGYNEQTRYAQDYELWSRLMTEGYTFSNIAEPLIKYRIHNESITQGAKKEPAYQSAIDTTYKNLSRLISIDRDTFTIFINAFHRQTVRSLKDLLSIQRIFNSLKNKNPKVIRYIRNEQRKAFQWYIKQAFPRLYSIASKLWKLL